MISESFLKTPIAHRALHDVAAGRPENSRAAISAAIQQGFGIEIDLQMSSDGEAVVFHDYQLDRLADAHGAVRQRSAQELGGIPLRGGHETIPSFEDVLALVDGKVPLLVEIKDQDGAMGGNVGELERAALEALRTYNGAIAVMSFNPESMAVMRGLAPDIPRGLVTDPYEADEWPLLSARDRDRLRQIPDYERVGACFVSHNATDLSSPLLSQLKQQGAKVLCWTVRSASEEARAREFADNVTFEGYLPMGY